MSITIRFLRERGDLRWRAIECVLVFILFSPYLGLVHILGIFHVLGLVHAASFLVVHFLYLVEIVQGFQKHFRPLTGSCGNN